jgi:hypothetical protein
MFAVEAGMRRFVAPDVKENGLQHFVAGITRFVSLQVVSRKGCALLERAITRHLAKGAKRQFPLL